MGYSARYHAASLAAVFLALAVGILLGVGLGDNVVSGTEQNLRESLESDIDEARAEADDLRGELEREQAFATRAYPALVGDTLRGRRIGLFGFGGLSSEITGDVSDALEPTGGELLQVSVIQVPPDVPALAGAAGKPFAKAAEDNAQLEALARRLGGQVARG